ncbi:CinA family protein [bacterium]|nr:CinA family protein [bacterium]
MEAAERLVKVLKSRNYKISGAESCTGGKVAAALTSVNGVSAFFEESFVVYSERTKIKNIGVRSEVIEKFGVVSQECAAEMAEKTAEKTGADVAFGVTGIAGPTGATPGKPVGMVCFGVSIRGRTGSTVRYFSGNRESVREQAVEFLLNWMAGLLEA